MAQAMAISEAVLSSFMPFVITLQCTQCPISIYNQRIVFPPFVFFRSIGGQNMSFQIYLFSTIYTYSSNNSNSLPSISFSCNEHNRYLHSLSYCFLQYIFSCTYYIWYLLTPFSLTTKMYISFSSTILHM